MFMWGGPFCAVVWCYLLSGLSYYISTATDAEGHSVGSNLLALGVRMRMYICAAHAMRCSALCADARVPRPRSQLLFSLLCSWVAAQLGAVQMKLADSLQVLCGAGLASTGIILCITLGWHRVATHPVLIEALDAKHGGADVRMCACALAAPHALLCVVRRTTRLAARNPGFVPRAPVRRVPAPQARSADTRVTVRVPS